MPTEGSVVMHSGDLLHEVPRHPEVGRSGAFEISFARFIRRLDTWLAERDFRAGKSLDAALARSIDEAFASFSREFRTY